MKKLSIPERITLRKEYLPGIGKTELRQIASAVIPGVIAAVAAWNMVSTSAQQLISLLVLFLYIALCYALFVRVDNSQSMYTYLRRIRRFRRAQQKFYYRKEKEAVYRVEGSE